MGLVPYRYMADKKPADSLYMAHNRIGSPAIHHPAGHTPSGEDMRADLLGGASVVVACRVVLLLVVMGIAVSVVARRLLQAVVLALLGTEVEVRSLGARRRQFFLEYPLHNYILPQR